MAKNNLKMQYRRKLIKLIRDSGVFDTVYVKFGVSLDVSKITIKDSDKPTVVVAFAGGQLSPVSVSQDLEAGYTDENAIYFYIMGRNSYLADDDDFSITSDIVENGHQGLITTIATAVKFRTTISQFDFDFLQYEYVDVNELDDNNITVLVQMARHSIEIYDDNK